MTMGTCCDSKADLPRIFFLNEPLAKFAASLDDCLNPDEPGMRPCGPFADVVAKVDGGPHKVDSDKLPEGKIRRSEIFELAADGNVSIATVCVAAMAWGGMNLGNWKLLWTSTMAVAKRRCRWRGKARMGAMSATAFSSTPGRRT